MEPKVYREIFVPQWLYEMPVEWAEAYFDVAAESAVSLRWGSA